MPDSLFGTRGKVFIVAIVFAVVGIGLFLVVSRRGDVGVLQDEETSDVGTSDVMREELVIGSSVEGREIEAYVYGDGEEKLLFVGGMHGGYEWNSAVLSYQFMDYLQDHPEVLPRNVTVVVIPSLNPDGVYAVMGKEGRITAFDVPEGVATEPGRFNARDVDLNRNFDCKWRRESMWRGEVVSAGSAPFSEPEARALRDFVMEWEPRAVVFWHSKASAVYASECEEGILPETLEIMNAYSEASGYRAVDSFDAYEITGDAEGWLASIGIPAITVELSTHESVEWRQNFAGVLALFRYYAK